MKAPDLILLFEALRETISHWGSLERCFLEGYDSEAPSIFNALEKFSQTLKEAAGPRVTSRGFLYFFPSPSAGSACKRLNMFLRWMARAPDGIDLGIWKKVSLAKLVIPLDVHIFRFAQRYKLSPYKTTNWNMAWDVTDFLRHLDPQDPLKYDFPVCHYGMEKGW